MTGTLINVGAILTGSLLGVAIGSRLPEKMRETVLHGLGLLTILVGMQMALGSRNILVVLGAILMGGTVGELLRISDRLDKLGEFLQSRLSSPSTGSKGNAFAEGFVNASLVFCIGPMAILGSMQDGLTGDFSVLTVKSVLDGFASIAFSASLGWGVSLSAITILFYQGAITIFAGLFSRVLTDPMIVEMTATGGLMIVGIGLRLLEVKQIRLANFLPALAIAPLIIVITPLAKTLI